MRVYSDVYGCPLWSEENAESPVIGVTGSGEPHTVSAELNRGPPREPQVLLTSKTSLQSLLGIFKDLTSCQQVTGGFASQCLLFLSFLFENL